MQLRNLTPHAITVRLADGATLTVEPEPEPARCKEERELAGTLSVDGREIPIWRLCLGEVHGLPEPQDGTILIVSRVVAEAARDRIDLLIPGPGLRDQAGRIVACDGLSRL
ncbi:MAG TPA: hypothetical protein VFD49_09090 [Candidatus Dormibacteraeota bacterium]|nr:hypothetical protein [Candidatus Dormibacteraeota bacterium]